MTSKNKKTVEEYMQSYNRLDIKSISSLLCEDVEWVLPGAFHLRGKKAFLKEIEDHAPEGAPAITVLKAAEENDIIFTEGIVVARNAVGEQLRIAFCDMFEMKDAKIRKLTSYVIPIENKNLDL